MANCPTGYTEDDYGNCVYMPINYDESFSDVSDAWADTDYKEIEDFITGKLGEQGWGEYESYFQKYSDSDLGEK